MSREDSEMTADEDELGRSYVIRRLAIAAALTATVFLLLFYYAVSNLMCFCVEFSELELAEANGDIKLPNSTRNLRGYTEGVNELRTLIRFEMDADDLFDFIDNSICSDPLKPTIPGSHTNDRVRWWDADETEKLMICHGQDGPSRQTILVDVSDPDTYRVFVSTSVH